MFNLTSFNSTLTLLSLDAKNHRGKGIPSPPPPPPPSHPPPLHPHDAHPHMTTRHNVKAGECKQAVTYVCYCCINIISSFHFFCYSVCTEDQASVELSMEFSEKLSDILSLDSYVIVIAPYGCLLTSHDLGRFLRVSRQFNQELLLRKN